MIHVFINEQSFVGQADTDTVANDLLSKLHEVLASLRLNMVYGGPYRVRGIADQPVREGMPLRATIARHPVPDMRNALLAQIVKGPYIDEVDSQTRLIQTQRRLTQPFEHLRFTYGEQSQDRSTLAYAAYCAEPGPFFGCHAPAALVSLRKCTRFAEEYIDVTVTSASTLNSQTAIVQTHQVWNVIDAQQVQRVARHYRANDGKHRPHADIKSYIAAMDLPPSEALLVLREGVLINLDNPRVFGKRNGNYYIFPCHDRTKNEFHGYRVKSEADFRHLGNVHAQLTKLGFFED